MSWGEVYKINSDMSTPLNALMNTLIASVLSQFTTSFNSLNSNINSVHANINSLAIIRGVQRGTVMSSNNPDANEVTINISSVNPSKSFVILQDMITYGSNYTVYNSMLISLTATTLKITGNRMDNGNPTNRIISPYSVSWQLVEFY